MIEVSPESGKFSAPSDWQIIFQFNTPYMPGSILIKSEVTEYDASDINDIKNTWQPTGTYWVNKT